MDNLNANNLMARETTFEKVAKQSIKKLEKRRDYLNNLLNDRPIEDLAILREQSKELLKEWLNDDGSFKESFWSLDNYSKIKPIMDDLTASEAKIHKRLDKQMKLDSLKTINEIVDIDSELYDLKNELYHIEKRKSKVCQNYKKSLETMEDTTSSLPKQNNSEK